MRHQAWESAAELDPYRDEPAQMRSGVVGKSGSLKLEFQKRGERSVLTRLSRRVPYLVQQALYYDEGMPNLPCVFLITTTGCVLQGDRLHLEVKLGDGAQAHLTTQSTTQIHSMNANYAAQSQDITLGEGAYLEYLPDPVCPHARSRFLSDTRIRMGAGSTAIISEVLMAGRKHHGSGELFEFELFSSRLSVEDSQGRELATEKLVVEPGAENLRQVGRMGVFDVFANVYALTPPEQAERIWAQTPAIFDAQAGLAAGASRLPNGAGLLFKVLGRETAPVVASVREFWKTVRQVATGAPVMKEFLWK